MISVLEKRGFYLKSISTLGQCSEHDCIDAFNHEYRTFEDHLFNEIHSIDIDISIGESNGAITPIEPYIFFKKDNVSEQDKMFLEQLKLDLDVFIKK